MAPLAQMRNMMLLLLMVGFAPADRPWADKPQTEWTLEDSNAVLLDSPWVQHKTFSNFVTNRLILEVRCYARLHSARPIRLALARLIQLQPGRHLRYAGPIDNDRVLETAQKLDTPGEVSLTLGCSSRAFRHMLDTQSPESMRESTYLMLTKDKKRVALASYHPPSETISRDALFRFPRPDPQQPLDKEIRFVTRFGNDRNIELDLKFKLKDLDFQGQVEY